MTDRQIPGVPVARGLRDRYCGTLRLADAGVEVALCGWVARRREHGEHLAFIDLRDYTGLVQCVVDGAHDLRAEYVVRVVGTVRQRPEGTANPGLDTGEIELGDCRVEILSPAEAPPFALDGRVESDEVVRLRYRFLDLRTERMQTNLRLRAVVNAAIRAAMGRQGFVEIETPLLWTPTPEGAREFAIPSRLQPGNFYVLPQSPQIAKQLTMIGGFDRYFQIARCMRDEDLRADRQFEFTQLDVEASFITQEDVWDFVTEAMLDAAEAATGTRPVEPVQMTWAEALDRYGTDKPDVRFEMPLIDLSDALATTEFNAFRAEVVKAIRLAKGGELGRARLDAVIERAKQLGARGLVWMRVVQDNGGLDVESPVAKFLSADERQAIVTATGGEPGDLVLIVAGAYKLTCQVLGALRLELGRPPLAEGPLRFCWVIDFPMFEDLDEDGRPVAAHHPFTMPHLDDLEKLASDPLAVRAQSYDLVLNGWELGSGSIRIHRPDIQRQVFAALRIPPEEAEARFGFLLDAFRYGAPPHGGFAVGLDRLVALLAGEENIREVIAFPKTQSGADLMTGAPKPLAARQLAELGLRLAVHPGPGAAPRTDGVVAKPASPDLFDAAAAVELESRAPLAARLRPRRLADVVGQRHLLAEGAPLRALIEADRLSSAIFFGPPGTGKTTLAELVASSSDKVFVPLSAVSAGVRDVREVLEAGHRRLGTEGRGTILFLDEIHRFSRAQQDALLPGVERGDVVLIGATTENPFFSLNAPLLSRSTLWRFEPLDRQDLTELARRGVELESAVIDGDALAACVELAEGDARAVLTTLEVAIAIAQRRHGGEPRVTLGDVEAARTTRALRHGRDEHYDLISALIKSMRGSDPDASVYWLARLLAAGEDPRFVARRMVIAASEDVGMADPSALVVAVAAAEALDRVGLPEAALNLAQAVIHLATAPKSNRAASALWQAQDDVASRPLGAVPARLRDAHYAGSASLGHGTGYEYPHDHPLGYVAVSYLPDELVGRRYYVPSSHGAEAEVAERLAALADAGGADDEDPDEERR